jgi:hypothetical protein
VGLDGLEGVRPPGRAVLRRGPLQLQGASTPPARRRRRGRHRAVHPAGGDFAVQRLQGLLPVEELDGLDQ